MAAADSTFNVAVPSGRSVGVPGNVGTNISDFWNNVGGVISDWWNNYDFSPKNMAIDAYNEIKAIPDRISGFVDNVGSYINNALTGERDYARDLEKMHVQNQFNSSEAAKNREWQTNMSNTAVQRAAKDYAAAGFNPALAMSSPASVPSGGFASSGSGGVRGSGSSVPSLIGAALKVANTAAGAARASSIVSGLSSGAMPAYVAKILAML